MGASVSDRDVPQDSAQPLFARAASPMAIGLSSRKQYKTFRARASERRLLIGILMYQKGSSRARTESAPHDSTRKQEKNIPRKTFHTQVLREQTGRCSQDMVRMNCTLPS